MKTTTIGTRLGVTLGLTLAVSAIANPACSDVLTWHVDNNRTGLNAHETRLTPSNVHSGAFGVRFQFRTEGQVYAQPLVVRNVFLPGRGANADVVYVADMHNVVYAIDAGTGKPIWTAHLGTPFPVSAVIHPDAPSAKYIDVSDAIGICGTPVIDRNAGLLYCVSKHPLFAADGKTVNGALQRLHALDIVTGHESRFSPVTIHGGVPGTGEGNQKGVVPFDPRTQFQRAGLVLTNGNIYIPYGSHADWPCYHGFLFAYEARTLKSAGIWCTTPDGNWGGIWQGGAAPASDGTNLYFLTGNSSDSRPGISQLGDCAVKTSLIGDIATASVYKPDNVDFLDLMDNDFGSGGILRIPDAQGLPFGRNNLVATCGKEGKVLLLNGDDLTDIALGLPGAAGMDSTDNSAGFNGWQFYGAPAYFNGSLYYVGNHDTLKRYNLAVPPLSRPDYTQGFANVHGLQINGQALRAGSQLRLTVNKTGQAGSAFTKQTVNVTRFATEFDYRVGQKSTTPGDGFAFVIQARSPNALGGGDCGSAGIGNSVALVFHISDAQYDNTVELHANGRLIDHVGMPNFFMESGHTFKFQIKYDGKMLWLVIIDMDSANTDWIKTFAKFAWNNVAHIEQFLGKTNAYVGFTATTSQYTAEQNLSSWGFTCPDAASTSWSNHDQWEVMNGRGSTPSISSNGNTNGIVWLIQNQVSDLGTGTWIQEGRAVLQAYEAVPGDRSRPGDLRELYSSGDIGGCTKFSTPTIDGGQVYVGTREGLVAFGLK